MGNINWNTQQFSHSRDTWVPGSQANLLFSLQSSIQAQFREVTELTAHDIQCYTTRAINNNCLVNVLALQDMNALRNGFKCQNKPCFRVLLQKVDYRLTDLGAISVEDGLYVLRQGIRAVQILSTIFDDFIIQQQSIGINNKGECKYWINSNYFKNTIETRQQFSQQNQQTLRQQYDQNPEQKISQKSQKQGYRYRIDGEQFADMVGRENIMSNGNNKRIGIEKRSRDCCLGKKYSSQNDSKASYTGSQKNENNSNNQNYSNKSRKWGGSEMYSEKYSRQKQGKKIHKTLEKLLQTIQNRMMGSLSSIQLMKYKKIKNNCLSPPNSNYSTNKYTNNLRMSYQYSMQNMQVLSNCLCKIFNIGSNHSITLPKDQQYDDMYNSVGNNRKSKLSLNKTSRCLSTIPSNSAMILRPSISVLPFPKNTRTPTMPDQIGNRDQIRYVLKQEIDQNLPDRQLDPYDSANNCRVSQMSFKSIKDINSMNTASNTNYNTIQSSKVSSPISKHRNKNNMFSQPTPKLNTNNSNNYYNNKQCIPNNILINKKYSNFEADRESNNRNFYSNLVISTEDLSSNVDHLARVYTPTHMHNNPGSSNISNKSNKQQSKIQKQKGNMSQNNVSKGNKQKNKYNIGINMNPQQQKTYQTREKYRNMQYMHPPIQSMPNPTNPNRQISSGNLDMHNNINSLNNIRVGPPYPIVTKSISSYPMPKSQLVSLNNIPFHHNSFCDVNSNVMIVQRTGPRFNHKCYI